MTGKDLAVLAPSRILVACMAVAFAACGADWPMFRGPDGLAFTPEKGLPTVWSGPGGTNILWKTELPAAWAPWSSPVAAGDRVFLTASDGNPVRTCTVLCFSKSDGRQMWQTPVEPGPWKQVDGRGSHAAPTPCTDGRNVYALFGSAAVAALDRDGRLLWRRELTNFQFDCNIGGSPVLCGDHVLIVADQNGGRSSLLAFDRRTGALAFEVPRKSGFAHSTPILAKVDGRAQLIVAANNAIQGIDPADGRIVWWASHGGETASPAFGGGIVFADSGRGGPGVAVRAGGTGDVTSAGLVAKFRNGSDLSSPVTLDGYVYRTAGSGLQCLKVDSGETVYVKQLPGISPWASPFATADGRVYVVSGGRGYVVKAGPDFALLAANDLGDPNHASPAVSDGRIIVRGAKYLWCIGTR